MIDLALGKNISTFEFWQFSERCKDIFEKEIHDCQRGKLSGSKREPASLVSFYEFRTVPVIDFSLVLLQSFLSQEERLKLRGKLKNLAQGPVKIRPKFRAIESYYRHGWLAYREKFIQNCVPSRASSNQARLQASMASIFPRLRRHCRWEANSAESRQRRRARPINKVHGRLARRHRHWNSCNFRDE